MSEAKLDVRAWLAGAVALVLLGGGAGYWLARHYGNSDSPAAVMGAERKVLYWHDPMVPGTRFNKPGKSPFMDMQLVPVYADEAGESPGVRVSANVAQSLGIRLGKVEKTTLKPTLSAVGSVAFDERLLEVVPARVEGYVTRLYIRAPLEHVGRGQPLAQIQAPAWLEAQQEYLSLLDAKSEAGQSLRAAARERLSILGVPESTIRGIESTRRANASTTIVSPIDGVVSELGVREGTAFMAGSPLFRLNGLATVWVNARIPEAQLSMVPTGSTAVAQATAWPGIDFKGRVIGLLPQVDGPCQAGAGPGRSRRLRVTSGAVRVELPIFVEVSEKVRRREPRRGDEIHRGHRRRSRRHRNSQTAGVFARSEPGRGASEACARSHRRPGLERARSTRSGPQARRYDQGVRIRHRRGSERAPGQRNGARLPGSCGDDFSG